jgi:ubiquinone/menaquinone biosynthesis C-methylase UbiE
MRIFSLLLSTCLLSTPVAGVQAPAGSSAATDAEQAKRERDLKMPEIILALELKERSKVADIGAGSGDYEAAMSRAVGTEGRVYAEDNSSDSIKRLRERVKKDHLGNVEVIEGAAEDPKLPSGELDAVLMVITYHEIADYQKMLEHVVTALKPGGRLVVVDMAPHKTLSRPREVQVKNHVIAPDFVESEIRQAGFEVLSRDDHFIDGSRSLSSGKESHPEVHSGHF